MKDKIELSVKKVIMLSVIMVTITAALVGVGTFAYFSATQVSGGNNFYTGSISFSVNAADPWTQNFNDTLADVKPGMTGWANVSVNNTGQNPADVWVMITNISTASWGTNTAKQSETAATDIDDVINYGLWNYTTATAWPASAYVPMGSYTVNKSAGTHSLAGTTNVSNAWIYIGTIQPGAANAQLVNQSFTLNTTVTNWAQMTNMSFTINFYAQQSQGSPRPSAPTTPYGELTGHKRT